MERPIDKKIVQFYILTACAFFALYSFAESFAYPDTILKRVINSFFLISYVAVLHFLFFEYIFPLFRLTIRKFVLALLLTGMLILLYTFGLYEWRRFWIQLHVYTDFTPGIRYLDGVALHSRFALASAVFFGIVRHIYHYNQLIISAKQLRIEKQEAELNYLKSQTNPHFLFNTLNNIYSLARDKSDLAPESILRLSKILRFMLYEAGGEKVLITQELKIIDDYIALEKLRYDESLRIDFISQVEDLNQTIPPLLLMPLVENAFKHGVSETRNTPFIHIELTIRDRQLTFSVINSKEETPEGQVVKENIGLSNLRRQLELLYREYDLTVKQDSSTFIVLLKLNLASHV